MNEPRPRQPGEKGFAVLLLVFSLLVLFQAYGISGFTSVSSPGVFPMAAATVMVVSIAAVILKDRRWAAAAVSGTFLRRVTPPTLIVILALMVGLMMLLEPAGFLVAAGAFLFAAILFLQAGRPVRAGLISVVALAAIYAVFRLVFQVVLPEVEWL